MQSHSRRISKDSRLSLWTITHSFYYTIVLFFTILCLGVRLSESSLSLISTCSCLGQTIYFECTTVGGFFTVWSGSAFMCQGEEISLQHLHFLQATGSCNNGAIVGRGVAEDNNRFTSRLSVTMTSELVGRTVTCSVDDGATATSVGTLNLSLSVANTFPPLQKIHVTSIRADEINFTWSATPPEGCPSFQYNVTSMDCGTCTPSLTTSNMSTCTNFINELHTNASKTCDIGVHSIICSNISGNASSLQANLKVPDRPSIRSIPHYNYRTSILQEIQTSIQTVESFIISYNPVINGSAVSYTITFADTSSSAICYSDTILASSCEDWICNHSLDVSLSSCPPNANITITVFATNILGNGQMSSPINLGGENTFVNVKINTSTRTVQCHFLMASMEGYNKQCIANVTYGTSCDQPVGTLSGEGMNNPITTPPLRVLFIDDISEYCISVTATSNNETVIVEEFILNFFQTGLLNSDNTYSYVTIAGIVTIVVTAVIITILVSFVNGVKMIHIHQRQQASPSFEVTPVLKLDEKSKAYFKQRKQNLNNLKNLKGIKPQATKLYSHYNFEQQSGYTIEEFHSKFEGLAVGEDGETETVKLVGRICAKAVESELNLITYVIHHINGKKVHIIADKKYTHRSPDGFKLFHSSVLIGDIVEVTGFPRRNSKKGLCLVSTKIELLSPCLHDIQQEFISNSNDGIHTGQRYLDLLVNDGLSRKFMTRTKMISFIRKFLDGKGFLEIETPMMNVVAGGAATKLMKSHIYTELNQDVYLRVAPELYHKMLVVGGFERVYEIGKQFCDEEIDRAHNPEFTTCEFYMAYADYKKVMKITEEMLTGLVKELNIGEKLEYHFDENNPEKKYIVDFKTPFNEIDIIPELEKQLGMTIQPSDFTTAKFNKTLCDICKQHQIAVPTPPTTAMVLRKLIEVLIVKNCINPTFILHHPQILCLFAKEHSDREGLTERFELIVCGQKVCNAYTDENDPVKQRELLEQQSKPGDTDAYKLDKMYCEALEYGLPPTAGWGMGIDRMAMILTDSVSIKEVMLFPAFKPLDKKRKITRTMPEHTNTKDLETAV